MSNPPAENSILTCRARSGRGGSRWPLAAGCWLLAVGLGSALAGGGEWLDCLSQARLAASEAALSRQTDGALAVRADGSRQALVTLAREAPESFDLQVELLWRPMARRGVGRAELAVGPHVFGSSGYRVVVQARPWQVAECRAPALGPGLWHSVEVRVRGDWLEYWLGGRLVARWPCEPGETSGLRLAVAPGCEAIVRRCRLRAAESAAARAGAPVLVCPAEAFGHAGRRVPDGAAAGGLAIEAAGAGEGRWLVRGQDVALGLSGAYAAVFGLRGVEGAGAVWLEVASPEGAAVAARSVRLEELPADGYARVRVPFRYEAGDVVEFRVAAERGRLRVDEVRAESAAAAVGDEAAGVGEAPPQPSWRARRALALAETWGKARQDRAPGLAMVGVERRLGAGGWYEFRARWRQEAAGALGDVAVDLWVACRDEWGIVRVLDFGAACSAVPRGAHETSAWLDPALLPRYGAPVAAFAQVYRAGQPVAAGWRKWGIPVDDQYIVGAQRAGALRAERPTE